MKKMPVKTDYTSPLETIENKKLVVACFLQYNSNYINENIELEFKELIKSAGYEILGFYRQKRNPTSKFFFGEGFWDNLVIELEQEFLTDVEMVIVNTSLSPLQYYHISKKLGKIALVDQFKLILEIFRKNASTQEAILQINLANLKYQLPFAKADLISERVSGERLGFMQSGELKSAELEYNFRKLETKIKEKLEKIKKQRTVRRKRRIKKAFAGEFVSLSLLGYTNAGKSSLLNTLTSSDVEVADRLFTTLGTTTRRFQYHDLPIILSDTVGFFEALPATLIDAFRSTLEESLVTDFNLVLVDVFEDIDSIKRKLITSFDTLKSINNDILNQVWVIFTKKDLVSKSLLTEKISEIKPVLEEYSIDSNNICAVSSISNDLEEFYQLLDTFFPPAKMKIHFDQDCTSYHSIRSKLYTESEIIAEEFIESEWVITLKTRRIKHIEKILGNINKVKCKMTYSIV